MVSEISVRYFAMLRELAGKVSEPIAINSGETAARLYMRLAEQYHFPQALGEIRVAVNDEFATTEYVLADGDRVVFIPPVAGG